MLFDFKNKKLGGAWETVLVATTVGLQLVSGTVVGLAIGYFLENWLCDTGPQYCWRPWVLLFFLIMGIVAGFKNMYLEVKKIQRAQSKHEHGDSAPDAGTDDQRPPQH